MKFDGLGPVANRFYETLQRGRANRPKPIDCHQITDRQKPEPYSETGTCGAKVASALAAEPRPRQHLIQKQFLAPLTAPRSPLLVGSNPTSSATKPQALLGLETTANLSGERSLYPNLSQSANCVPQRSAKPWYLRSEITVAAYQCRMVAPLALRYYSRNVEGLRISHYRILRRLGSGGMGEVYAAEDERLRRDVAIKFISLGKAANENARRRFEREARAASALNHPNICTIFEVSEHEGQPFLVMELLDGQDLRQVCAAGPVEISSLLKWGIEITDALAGAHARGIVHRDIKPGNVFVTLRGDAKVLDFGLAKLRVSEDMEFSETVSLAATATGSVMGTVAYMSPEQARGEVLDARTDLFSLGAVLYEMASSKPAFAGATAAIIFNSILAASPTPLSRVRGDVPPELESIISRALEKDRKARYQSAAEMKADLKWLQRELESRTLESTAPSRAARRNLRAVWIGAALMLAVLVGVLGGFLRRPRTQSPQLLSHRTTIAVLPFQNTTADNSLDYLSTALPDEVHPH